MSGRGALNKEVQAVAKKFLGKELTVTELRLIPYIQYVMVNEQRIDLPRINQEDREILSAWKKKKYLTGGAGPMTVTREFWDFMCEVLWHTYVNIEEA